MPHEPGDYSCIKLYALTTPLSAQIAEWLVHKVLCNHPPTTQLHARARTQLLARHARAFTQSHTLQARAARASAPPRLAAGEARTSPCARSRTNTRPTRGGPGRARAHAARTMREQCVFMCAVICAACILPIPETRHKLGSRVDSVRKQSRILGISLHPGCYRTHERVANTMPALLLVFPEQNHRCESS